MVFKYSIDVCLFLPRNAYILLQSSSWNAQQMKKESKVDELPESKVTILIESKEDLIYDKHTGSMVGFVNLGLINDQLLQAE